MPPRSNVPIRIGGSRQRSGCRTCKQRHVKCDEQRPTCANCRRGNRDCTYEPLLTTSRRSTPPHRTDPGVAVARFGWPQPQLIGASFLATISPHGALEGFETRALQHFVSFVGKELAGSFSDSVWCDILPRAAQHEPSIWHGIVAISTLDRSLRLDHSAEGERTDPLAITHYTKAIQELHTRLDGARDSLCKDVTLMSCILFAVFECLQSHYSSALKHISGGMKLLVEWGGTGPPSHVTAPGNYLDRTALQSVFLTLDSQAIQLGAIGFRDMFSGPALDDLLETPIMFSTVEDAHLVLNQIFHRLSHWSSWVEPPTPLGNRPDETLVSLEERKIQDQLDEWDTAFQTLLEISKQDPASLLLLVQRNVIQAYFGKHADGPSEVGWDKYLPYFEEAVSYAEAYMELVTRGSPVSTASLVRTPPPKDSRLKLTIAMDVVLPLFLIGTRCRDPQIRRRALQMLRDSRCKEGIWDSQILARMTEKLIHTEESRAREDGFIPEDARMFMVDVLLDEVNTVKVVPKTLAQLSNADNSEALTEDEW